jgi:hypothetical protein
MSSLKTVLRLIFHSGSWNRDTTIITGYTQWHSPASRTLQVVAHRGLQQSSVTAERFPDTMNIT